jgi:hypothetical protein
MVNRVRKGYTLPSGTGETAGFIVDQRTNRLKMSVTEGDGTRYIGGQAVEVKTEAFSITAKDDGKTFLLRLLAGFEVQLPASDSDTAGMIVTIVNDLLPTSGNGYDIAPASGEWVSAPNLNRTADQVLRNPVASDQLGDFVTLQADGAGAWRAIAIGGTWSKA